MSTMVGDPKLSTKHHSEVPITQRQLVTHEIPVEWLDRLLVAQCSLGPAATLADIANMLVDVAAELFTDLAIGVCIPSVNGQVVVRRSTRASLSQAPDPTKLFPEFAYERVMSVPLDETSTLHAATDDERRLEPGTPADVFLDRLGLVLGAAIQRVRTAERSNHEGDLVRTLQAQVIQSEKLASLGQIAAGIVHELNNPLTSIVAYSDFLRKKYERAQGDAGDIERLSRINEAAERILRFSRDLIAYSRPTAEVPAPVAIHDVIERALVFCEHVLDQTGVVVEKRFTEVPAVSGVAGQLTQVFVNLFTNAAHAMQSEGGQLSITTARSNATEVTITISDDGHGIDADNLPRIFDPYFTTKSDGGGTGLGLSIVRNIIVSHGGHIRADGLSPRGTVFYVDLPIAATGDDPA